MSISLNNLSSNADVFLDSVYNDSKALNDGMLHAWIFQTVLYAEASLSHHSLVVKALEAVVTRINNLSVNDVEVVYGIVKALDNHKN